MKKFVSKNQEYSAVLKPGTQGNRLTGEPTVPMVNIRFVDGVALLDEEYQQDLIEMARRHPAYGTDFIEVMEEELDPYAGRTRRTNEPEHDLIDIEYGHIGKNRNPKPAVQMTPEQLGLVKKLAAEIAMEMAPKLAERMMAEKEESVVKTAEKSESVTAGSVETEPTEEPEVPEVVKEEPADEGEAERTESEKRKPGRPKKSESKSS